VSHDKDKIFECGGAPEDSNIYNLNNKIKKKKTINQLYSNIYTKNKFEMISPLNMEFCVGIFNIDIKKC